MITIDFKFYQARYKTIAFLLSRMVNKGVEHIGIFTEGRNDPDCFWVRVVGTFEQLQTPTGLYREFLNKVIKFEGGTAFEKACVTFDMELSFAEVEHLIPPPEQYGFLKMLHLHAALGYSRAYLCDNMSLEARRIEGSDPEKYRVELTIWQGQFRYIMNPVGTFDTLLKYYKNLLSREGALSSQVRLAAYDAMTHFTPSTMLEPQNFWPQVSRTVRASSPGEFDVVLVSVPGYKVVVSDSNGILQPDSMQGGVSLYRLDRLTAMNGLWVTLVGEQLISCYIMEGAWQVTFHLPTEVMAKPSGPYLTFTQAMAKQATEHKAAKIAKAAAA